MEIAAMTKKDLEYDINLADRATAGLRGLTPILKETLLWVKSYQTTLHATEKFFIEERISGCPNFTSDFLKKFPQPPQRSATRTLIRQ